MFGLYDPFQVAQQQYYAAVNTYGGLQNYTPSPPAPVRESSRIQAVLSAGHIKAACESAIAKYDRLRTDTEKAAIADIQDLPETTNTKYEWQGWWIFKKQVAIKTVHVPSQAEQDKHRAEAEERVKSYAASWYAVPPTIKTLHALSSHFPPSHPMPLEGDYLTAIAEYLEPFEDATTKQDGSLMK